MDTKKKILDCAFNILCKKGYDHTSVREIAGKADVNVAMINYYFGGKEKLFDAVLQNRLSGLHGIFTEMVKDQSRTAIEKIESVIDLVIDRKFSNREFHYLLHSELALKRRPELKEKISEYIMLNISPVKKIIKEGISSGEFRKVDIGLTVTTIIGTIHYLLVSDTICQKILGKPSSFAPFRNKELKERVNAHLKALVRSHLLKQNVK